MHLFMHTYKHACIHRHAHTCEFVGLLVCVWGGRRELFALIGAVGVEESPLEVREIPTLQVLRPKGR